MKVFRGTVELPKPLAASTVAIGNFDGVHLGHRQIFRLLAERSRKLGLPSVVYTFKPHPAKLLSPALAPSLLTSYEEKLELIAACDVDIVIEEPFTPHFAALTAQEFVNRRLVDALGVKTVFVGRDFSFGKDRGGDPDVLARLGRLLYFETVVAPPFKLRGMVVSSTKVREFVLEGRLRGATLMLGRPFSLSGHVVEGFRRGRRLGFPTANIEPEGELIPKRGVYVCRLRRHRLDRDYDAVVNVGFNPTFGDQRLTVEAYVLDFADDLYGERVRLAFLARIRDEIRFAGPTELTAQIASDIEAARAILKSPGNGAEEAQKISSPE